MKNVEQLIINSELLSYFWLQKRLKEIQLTEIKLVNQLSSLERQWAIIPAECILIEGYSRKLGDELKELCQYFRSNDKNPKQSVSEYLVIINDLYEIQESSSQLSEHILSFLPICFESEKVTRKPIQKIQISLSTTIKLLREIIYKSEKIARFQFEKIRISQN